MDWPTEGMIPSMSSFMSWWVCWGFVWELGKELPTMAALPTAFRSQVMTSWKAHQWSNAFCYLSASSTLSSLSSLLLYPIYVESQRLTQRTLSACLVTFKFLLDRQLSLRYISYFLQQGQCYSGCGFSSVQSRGFHVSSSSLVISRESCTCVTNSTFSRSPQKFLFCDGQGSDQAYRK